MISIFISVFFTILLLKTKYVWSKYEEGILITSEKWAFVSRFCFLSDKGVFQYTIEYDKEYAVQNLLLYYDTPDQWPSVYRQDKEQTCEERESYLNVSLNQVVNLTEKYTNSGCRLRTLSDRKKIYVCQKKNLFISSRPRWWFLAISNCKSVKGLNLKYKFLMTNGPDGDFWHMHFSADEFYVMPQLIGYFCIYIMLVVAVTVCSVRLKSRKLYHSTYKLFYVSVVLQLFGITFLMCAYAQYGLHGINCPGMKTIGQMLEIASEVVFLLLLLLIAKGFTITRARLRLPGAVKLTIFMSVYVVASIVLFVYKLLFFDPGKVLYLYESPAGYGLIMLRICAWGMFVYSIVFTVKYNPAKVTFYYPLNMIGTLWFVSGPVFILAANSLIDKWVRESVVCGVLHFVALLGHILFLITTLPSHANKMFPYHVRTTQVGVMSVMRAEDLPFVPHAYAPSAPPLAPPLPAPQPPLPQHNRPPGQVGEWRASNVPVELFCVSRNVEVPQRPLEPSKDVTHIPLHDSYDSSPEHNYRRVPDVFQINTQRDQVNT
ncbi:transmembrane protein 145-like isoform X1 [Schistocerca americana]|uniref:transmembrane protein 145-like isoform X1 n=1 Tax=Schistocerca americana TaxID=7009 RepID=UPI001F5011B8|nr:transmembrane protein 145-like isoform X1 [Schistocerca americana]